MNQAFAIADQQILGQYETVIENGMRTFLAVADALITIKRLDLWRGEYTSFADYCKRRWNMGTSTVYNYMRSAVLFEEVPRSLRDSITMHKAVELSRYPQAVRHQIMKRKDFITMSVRDIKTYDAPRTTGSVCPTCGNKLVIR